MNYDDILASFVAAHGDPERLTLATLDIFLADRGPGVREALEAAAVPHWFDADILAALLGVALERATTVCDDLRALPMVEVFEARAGWNVHEAARLAIRSRMAGSQNDRFVKLSRLAAECFSGDDEPVRQIE